VSHWKVACPPELLSPGASPPPPVLILVLCPCCVCRLLVAPALIESLGWESVFYLFGLGGIAWCFYFNQQQPVLPADPLAGMPSGRLALFKRASNDRSSTRSCSVSIPCLPNSGGQQKSLSLWLSSSIIRLPGICPVRGFIKRLARRREDSQAPI
jgi:hypothetical protein